VMKLNSSAVAMLLASLMISGMGGGGGGDGGEGGNGGGAGDGGGAGGGDAAAEAASKPTAKVRCQKKKVFGEMIDPTERRRNVHIRWIERTGMAWMG
jgi:hypothetical protein